MWQGIAKVILRNRFIIIGIITLMTVFFGYNAATGLEMDNKYGILLPKNAPAKINYDHFIELFGEDGGTLVIAIETDSLFTEQNFLKWKQLGDSILLLDGIKSVVSEATLFTVYNNQEEQKFEAHRVFSDISYGEKSIDSVKREIKNNPLYRGLLYNNDEDVTLMMISVDENFISDQKKSGVVLDLEAIADSYSGYFGKMRYAGLPHLRVIIGKRIMKEMYIFVGLLFLITSLLMFFFFRSMRVIFICNLVILIAVIWSMGSIAVMGFHISVIMALIPPLMIVIGVPNCIFLFTKYHQEVKEHGNKVKALSRVITKIGTATFLTNLTTSFGFLTFITTNSPKLMEFGVTAALNIMAVFVLSICILPIIISFSKSPKPRHLKHLDRNIAVGLLDNLVHITLNHRKWVYVVAIAVATLSIIGLTKVQTTGNITSDLPEGNQILEDFTFIQDEFGGSIPFEIMIKYKEPSRLAKSSTLLAIEEIQTKYEQDTIFAKFISYIDMLKAANMAYHDNDSSHFKLITSKRKLKRLKDYIDNSFISNTKGVGVALNELMDTSECVLRIRSQMKDLGSLVIRDIEERMGYELDSIMNPNKAEVEKFYTMYDETGKNHFVDSILLNNNGISNQLAELYISNDEERFEYDSDPQTFLSKKYDTKEFKNNLRETIDFEYFDVILTGTSILSSNGTRYMTMNLFTSLMFAIIAIAILMAILFRSWRMVLISLIPNFLPLLFTGGIMGWFGIPLKPSTLLVFSIAFGISVDDTIHYLAKYRQELNMKQWDLKQCVIMAIRESGLGMFYTSIILFCGFIVFTFSQFGGTQALGLLISLTLLVAMITNLVLLPSLLLSLERRLTTRSFEEPYFDAYTEESNIDWDNLYLQREIDDSKQEPLDLD